MLIRKHACPKLPEHSLDRFLLFRKKEKIPERFALHLIIGVAGQTLTGGVELDNTSLRIKHDHQHADGLQNGDGHVKFAL